ncbi:MBL fold metallo-hydrolase [Neptunicella marina]|uniref:MBL fold metallo-hydrolase n=1 Tax=Neptunicella marina TaxID=2125989 RepID=A0A8J6IV41_9ALTE|nr:MBL fold metallo-hydrolase [Neptunicella marina]
MNIVVIPVTPFQQNCSIIWDPDTLDAAIIDPGGDEQLILDKINELQLSVKTILLTHGHLDHVGATTHLAQKLQVPVNGPHPDDAFWLNALEQQSAMFGFGNIKAFTPTKWLKDGDSVSLGNKTLQVLHCPGHTPGHLVFYEPTSKKVIVGDVLFAGSIGRTDFPQGNHAQLIESIRSKLFSLPDDVTVYPGHGPTTTIGQEKSSNPFVSDKNYG